MHNHRDTIYQSPLPMLVDFQFDQQVVAVFPDMIRRSVPGYSDMVAMLALFAEKYAVDSSNIYDLGSSLGASTLALLQRLGDRDITLVAIDNSPAMIDNSSAKLQDPRIQLRCDDITSTTISNASLVVLNFTLQFIAPEQRQQLIDTIYAGLRPGGALVLAEKICFSDESTQQWHQAMHHRFKQANGYSELEISQKRAALEKVLIPETIDQHINRLQQAGFRQIENWYRCFNFISIVAEK